MSHEIMAVQPGSIAEQLGVAPGDRLVSINAHTVVDWIDYQAFSCEADIALVIARGDEELEITLQKDEYEPLGLQFSSQLMTPLRLCANHCVFCFVDQLPVGARDSMRVKDDDWRLSLMMGNFVTLTNVSDRELTRIIERRASPMYISVHATDERLRAYLLGVRRNADILGKLRRLAGAGLSFHAQAVLCPGLNDGTALENTVRDLAEFLPHCLSLALVPVGLTEHRDGLCELKKYDAEGARRVVEAVAQWQREFRRSSGFSFVHASDEFYLTAGCDTPPDEHYDDYPQIENGVGLMRLLETEFDWAWREADLKSARPAHLLIATGTSAAPFLRALIKDHPIPGVTVEVRAIENGYFGKSVTVAGLLTGGDLIAQLAGACADRVLITQCMLREGEDVFLDGVTLSSVQDALKTPVVPVGRRGEDLLEALMRA